MPDFWAVYGPDPGVESHDPPTVLLEIFKDETEAEAFLGSVLMSSAAAAIQNVRPGGTFSLLLTRGNGDMTMTGGYAVSNPDYKNRSDYVVRRLRVQEESDD